MVYLGACQAERDVLENRKQNQRRAVQDEGRPVEAGPDAEHPVGQADSRTDQESLLESKIEGPHPASELSPVHDG